MPEEHNKTTADAPATPASPQPPDGGPPPAGSDKEKEIGDFITRQVLEKDSVFFEG